MEDLWRMGEIFQLSAVRGESKRSGTEDKEADSSTYRCKLTMNQQRQRQSQSHGRPKKRKVCNEHDVDTDASLNDDEPPKKWHLSHVVILRRLHIK